MKGQTLLFHCIIIPWRLSTDISLFLSVVISLDIKFAFHYKKKKATGFLGDQEIDHGGLYWCCQI